MNRRILYTIVIALLCCSVVSATVTHIDSIPNFVNNTFKGGTIFKVGVATDLYGIIYTSTTTDNLLVVATFSCSDAGVLPASVIATSVFGTGSGTVGNHPAAIQIPNTEHFIGTLSHDATGSNDSTWVYLFGVDTVTAAITGVTNSTVIKLEPTRDHVLVQIGTSNYFALAWSRTDAYTCDMKTFLVDPITPGISDVTIDSLSSGGYSMDIDRVGSSDYYVISTWGTGYNVETKSISQADGTIGAQADLLVMNYKVQLQNSRMSTYSANDSIFVGASQAFGGSDKFFHSFEASPYDGALTRCDSVSVETKFESVAVAANDSGAFVFYSGYWTGYDGYLAAYSIGQITGEFTETQQLEKQWSGDLTADNLYISSMMLTDDSRYVLLSHRSADPFYGTLRTMLISQTPHWGHERDGIAYPNVNSIDGVGIADVLEVDGVEK